MRRTCFLALAGVLTFAACGSDDTKDATPASESTTSSTAAAAQSAADEHAVTEGMEGMEHGHDTVDTETVVSDDKGLGMLKNGHHKEMVYKKLTSKQQKGVDALLDVSREVAAQYPTLADFKAAGANRAGPYSPGLGIHYTLVTGNSFNPDGVSDETDMRNPLVVIYDGTKDNAKIAGFMYYSLAAKQPSGFPGPNDFWHYHTDICTVTNSDGEEASIGADGSFPADKCLKLGGRVMAKTQWMVHVWSIPGYEVSDEDGGVFAEVNPKLDCPDGSYHMMDQKYMIDHPENVCESELTKS